MTSKFRKGLISTVAVISLAGAGLYFWNRSGHSVEHQTAKETYYCPMHPSYKSAKPDNCPVCSMKLVKLEPAPGEKPEASLPKDTYYCPMHPNYKSDKQGNCPICSMQLVKVEPAPPSSSGAPSGHEHGASGMLPESASEATGLSGSRNIFIHPQRQQLIGVKFVSVSVVPLVKEIRAVGKVAFDETKVTHIHTKVTGYVEHVFVDFVGQIVKKGDRLFTIYSPDLVATQEEYLLALRSRSVLKDSSFPWISSGSQSLLDATRQRLRLWDVQDAEIEQLEKDGKVKRELTIYSPVNGLVTEREAFHHGRFVSPEMDLYKLVDLSTVWILGEVYESELPYVRNGQAVEIELPYAAQATSLRGRVTYVYPYLEPKTRTVQVRMEFPNPGYRLRPGMFVNVKLKADLGRSIAVPEDAVLDTGTRQYVFVDRGEGYLEPRPVKAGAEAEGYIAIESGLRAGERVATAANFILDSESRLKGAFASMGTPEALQVESSGAKASGLRAEIVEPSVAKVGRNLLRVRITDASGRPVSGAGVELSLFMPQMANMAAMNVKATLEPMQDGQYQGQVDIPMAFSWQTIIAVRKDDKAMGTVHTTLLAR